MLLTLQKKEITSNHVEPRDGDIKHSLADISRAKEAFGYIPKYEIFDGLKETIKWF